jgi:hypothetical protein
MKLLLQEGFTSDSVTSDSVTTAILAIHEKPNMDFV